MYLLLPAKEEKESTDHFLNFIDNSPAARNAVLVYFKYLFMPEELHT
jgi:hypothetical protein